MSIPFAHVAGAFVPLEVFPITIAGILYWHRAMVLSWDGRRVPLWRQICFGAGLATIAVALFSPIGHISDELVVAHMGEHLLIGDLAPLLIVLGLTRLAAPAAARHRGLRPAPRLAHPLVALPLWAADLYLWHVPALYQAAVRHRAGARAPARLLPRLRDA